ncbi:TetR/AcrR family transcriptional regulator [Cohnella herbarum]|uniref:TetR/AcrR family transcriptional regulator n=1 Tax=Cohnella herbarum TaxID=2728023 RepID=A0A7Z2VPB4_9BACL|nr:TetR/AcrR family transcriptional regulator [Cohnella herbarum]QJD86686.1 TetR/AcrR family transcriptional regulator [Cohnella herbarum]
MQDKKKQILDAAIRCFARKGFNATSIQEIVDELGMAKGSIYFYFKSKDDLFVSVIEYYGEMLFELMTGFPEEAGLPPREKLILQWERQFGFVVEHLDFMRMLISEPLTGLHPQLQKLMIQIRARSHLWHVHHLLAIYGDSVEDYLEDAAALFSGIVKPFFEAMLFEEWQFDSLRLSKFLLERLDDLVTGIIEDKETQILPSKDLKELRRLAGYAEEEGNEEMALLRQVADLVMASSAERDDLIQGDLLAALGLLKEEIVKPRLKNHFLARAMLALLKQHVPDSIMEPLSRLERSLSKNGHLA